MSFDPIGKYLLSQGDDNKIIVWNVNNWDNVKEITEPFEKSVDAIFFRFKFFKKKNILIFNFCQVGHQMVNILLYQEVFQMGN